MKSSRKRKVQGERRSPNRKPRMKSDGKDKGDEYQCKEANHEVGKELNTRKRSEERVAGRVRQRGEDSKVDVDTLHFFCSGSSKSSIAFRFPFDGGTACLHRHRLLVGDASSRVDVVLEECHSAFSYMRRIFSFVMISLSWSTGRVSIIVEVRRV
jgi:hypothetical protein